jgi:hypothetical protein
MAGEHAGLLTKLREQYKEAFFVHCYAHRLNLVLSQSVSFLEHVETFFASLSGFGTSFSKSTKREEALDAEIKGKYSHQLLLQDGTTTADSLKLCRTTKLTLKICS